MSGFKNETLYCENLDFRGVAQVEPQFNAEGQLPIGTGATPSIEVGVITSPLGTITVGYSNPNITIDLAGGGTGIDSINVDANTPPGTDPVVPNASGQVTITGAQVAAGTVGANVIRTDSLAANTFTIEVQRSTTAATPTSSSNGVSHFNSDNFNVDSDGFVSAKSGFTPGVTNLGIALSGGTFTVQGADGNALSSTNPAYVTLQSKSTPGRLVTIAVTANQTFVDNNGSSTIAGATFGVTVLAGTAYTNDMPYWLYAVLNDSENAIAFMISRYPCASTSPVAAKIGKTGSTAAASTQGSFFSLGNPTVADYESNPCLCIGAFRMRSTTNVGDWAVQTLSIDDGIGKFHEYTQFIQQKATFGAATNSFFTNNGGTAPQFNDASSGYYVSRDGWLLLSPGTGGCSTAGVGAVNLTYASVYNSAIDVHSYGTAIASSGAVKLVEIGTMSGSTNTMTFHGVSTLGEGAALNNNFVTVADGLRFEFTSPIQYS